jgi:hypothetical protein
MVCLHRLGAPPPPPRPLVDGVETRPLPIAVDLTARSVALYPDELLTQILMASTYPLEIVQAARWTKGTHNILYVLRFDKQLRYLLSYPSESSLLSFEFCVDLF